MTTAERGAPARRDPVRLALPGRTLLLVAGMPGAGKSTLLAALAPAPGLVVLDSERYRAALARVLPARTPYSWYRPLVHLGHRAAVVKAVMSSAPTVVVHLPATSGSTRAALARLAAQAGRTAHLLWVDVDPRDALLGQRARGRVVPGSSFTRHAERGVATAADLRAGLRPAGWATVTLLDRSDAGRGLRLDTR
ncbi:MAG TPA: AAA family ATPase [Pseudonocardia sp.]|nr:AAA family ATPase [Pseudonocardia sp.]